MTKAIQFLALPLLLAVVPAVSAQTTYYPYRRRSNTARIIGAIIGGVFILLCLCVILAWSRKRRRARMAYTTHPMGMGNNGVYNQNQGAYVNGGAGYGAGMGKKPLFGGGGVKWSPFGKKHTESTAQPFVPQQGVYGQHAGGYPQQSYTPGYGQQGGYDAGYQTQQTYAAPAGPPLGAGVAQPPPAYSGNDKVPASPTPVQAEQGFVGGFRH